MRIALAGLIALALGGCGDSPEMAKAKEANANAERAIAVAADATEKAEELEAKVSVWRTGWIPWKKITNHIRYMP
jgi:hypothetical protein